VLPQDIVRYAVDAEGIATLTIDYPGRSMNVIDQAFMDSLDAALARLGDIDSRALEVAEMRFFAGMEVAEIAAALGISERTVKRDTRFVRDFLAECLAQ